MNTYHKIQTIYFRDPENNMKTLLEGQWSKPEFEYLAENKWYCTEKIDGTNMRILWDGKQVEYRGKTDNADISKHLLPFLEETFTNEKMSKVFGNDPNKKICVYGEGYGKGIQKGGNYMSDKTEFILFDVLIDDWWIQADTLKEMAYGLEVMYVPEIGVFTLYEVINMVKKGFISNISENRDYIAEGIIAKPLVEMSNRKGERIITKIKHKDFK